MNTETLRENAILCSMALGTFLGEQASLLYDRNLKRTDTPYDDEDIPGVDSKYSIMKTSMIMNYKSGDRYSDEQIYDNLARIAINRYDMVEIIDDYKNMQRTLLNVLYMAKKGMSLYYDSGITDDDILKLANYICENEDVISQGLQKAAVVYPTDDVPTEKIQGYVEFKTSVAREYLSDTDNVIKLLKVLFTINEDDEQKEDISELPYIDEYGRLVDECGNSIISALFDVFDRKTWSYRYDDEILLAYLNKGYDLSKVLNKDCFTWVKKDILNKEDFPYCYLDNENLEIDVFK